MGWKKLPTWVKGGIFGLVIYFFYFLLANLSYSLFWGTTSFFAMLEKLIYRMPLSLFNSIFPIYSYSEEVSFWKAGLIPMIFWFVIGVVVGWIVGKIRKK